MVWPTETTPKDNISDSQQSPDEWRKNLFGTLVDAVNAMVTGRGVPNGVAATDSDGLVDVTNIPVVPVQRGGTGGTTQGTGRDGLGLGTAATKGFRVAFGCAGLNANVELREKPAGAAAAPANYVFTAGNGYVDPAPGAGTVSRTALKTATGSFSASVVTGQWQNIVLPGGTWGFYPSIESSGSSDRFSARIATNEASTSEVARISIFADFNDGGGTFARGTQRYLLASPPYDYGDGECEDFLFVRIEDGKPGSTYFSCDPPHANNGRVAKFGAIPMKTAAELADPRVREAYIEDLICERWEPIAEGMALKMYDMSAIPHPFDPGSQVVMVDPMGDEIRQLRKLMHVGHSPAEFLDSGALTLDNEPLKRCGPPGVPVVRARWRQARA